MRTEEDLNARWREAARQHHFDASSVERLRSSRWPMTGASEQDLLKRLTEFDARFTEREARAVALGAVRLARRLTVARLPSIPHELVGREAKRLDKRLQS